MFKKICLKKYFYLICFSAFIFSCATSPKAHYSRMKAIPQSKVAQSPKEAIGKAKISKISMGKVISSGIEDTDPLMAAGNPLFRTNYEVFSFTGEAGKEYRIEVKSLCDCLGFSKLIMVPLVQVVDGNGTFISGAPKVLAEKSPSFSDPYHFFGAWEFSAPIDGKVSIIVASNNSHYGSSVGYVKDVRDPSARLKMSATGSPYGDYKIKVVAK